MSIFASRTQATIPLTLDEPHTITIRKLTGRELERAQADNMKNVVAGRDGRTWSTSLRKVLANSLSSEADVKVAVADPLNGLDRFTVILAGLISWTYEEPVSVATVDDLDDDAAEFIARAVMRLTKPALFQTEAEQETARKNG